MLGKTAIFDLEKGKTTVQFSTILAVLRVLNIQFSLQSPIMHLFKKVKRAKVFVDNNLSGYLVEIKKGQEYEFRYLDDYVGSPISLTMPVTQKIYVFETFPPFFEGFLPEGIMLDSLLRRAKIDKEDLFEQLMCVGSELVGNVTVKRDL